MSLSRNNNKHSNPSLLHFYSFILFYFFIDIIFYSLWPYAKTEPSFYVRTYAWYMFIMISCGAKEFYLYKHFTGHYHNHHYVYTFSLFYLTWPNIDENKCFLAAASKKICASKKYSQELSSIQQQVFDIEKNSNLYSSIVFFRQQPNISTFLEVS